MDPALVSQNITLIVTALTSVTKLLKGFIDQKKASDKEIKDFVDKCKKDVLKPLYDLDLTDIFQKLCNGNKNDKLSLLELYKGITEFCLYANSKWLIQYNPAIKSVADDLINGNIYHKLCLISVYFKSKKDDAGLADLSKTYERLGAKLKGALTNSNNVFEKQEIGEVLDIVNELGLEVEDRKKFKKIGPKVLDLDPKIHKYIDPDQNHFTVLSIDDIVDESGLMIWKMGKKVIYYNKTISTKTYMKNVSSIYPYMCKTEATNHNYLKLNRYITQKNVKYCMVKIPKEHLDFVRDYIKYLMKPIELDLI